jgi:DNA primase
MIDKATVDQIIAAADIVDVVSDFVSLHRRGANFVGLCPFHDEKTPSFYVSRAKGICHCFGCGKGGSPVNFIMEHEQMTYYEALKYLANKYHIEIHERELTDNEKAEQSERESMFIINEFAGQFFEDQLHNTTNGKEIGLPYFYERGFSDETIKSFHLGYSPEGFSALYDASIAKGYNKKFLFDVGLCIEDKHDGGYDRFRGRVMFPVFNVAGKIIAFGGRTLKKDPAKYINSPESIIYKKKNELYGLFQAKGAIVKEGKCFLVEGYTDVISMHQAGIKNVVASSGTSLTDGQIRMIHRFTENVTILYDGDSAGIHASLRGIDMLLSEGLNIKVLLLPDGEDPDSYARTHSATEFQNYITEHETDFIRFKMKILLADTVNDPIKMSSVIADVVKSISVIPSAITQSIYAKECSKQLNIREDVLLREIQKDIVKNKEEEFKRKERERNHIETVEPTQVDKPLDGNETIEIKTEPNSRVGNAHSSNDKILYPYEKAVIRYVAKYGMCYLCDYEYENGEKKEITLVEFIDNELCADLINFSNSVFNKIFTISRSSIKRFYSDLDIYKETINEENKIRYDEGVKKIADLALDMDSINAKEEELKKEINISSNSKIDEYRQTYLEKKLCSDEDDEVREISLKLVSSKYHLSKIHTQYATIKSEYEKLGNLVPESLNNWKYALIRCQAQDIQKKLNTDISDEEAKKLLERLQTLNELKCKLAKLIGERVVNPF